MFDHLLESSHRDDSNKWSHIGIGDEIGIIEIKIRTLSGALHLILLKVTLATKILHKSTSFYDKSIKFVSG